MALKGGRQGSATMHVARLLLGALDQTIDVHRELIPKADVST